MLVIPGVAPNEIAILLPSLRGESARRRVLAVDSIAMVSDGSEWVWNLGKMKYTFRSGVTVLRFPERTSRSEDLDADP